MSANLSDGPTMPPPRLDFWRKFVMIGLGVAALATYAGLVAFDLRQSFDRESEFARHNQESLARILQRHALATIDKIDTVLVASQLRLNDVLADEPRDAPAINTALRHYLGLIDESQSLRVADRTGHFIYDASGVLSSATIADRDYFLRSRADRRSGLIISEPIFARITHNWVITLSRRIDDRKGQFAGLVQAAVRADYFQDFYKSLNLGTSQSVSLLDDKLRLVARYPAAPAMLGKPLDSPFLRQLQAEGKDEGVYTTTSRVDGVHRLYAMRKVGHYPLYIVTGRATDDYLANWYSQAWRGVGSAIALAIVITGWIVVWLRTYDKARRLALGMTEAYATTVRRTRALLDSLPDPAWLSDRSNRMIAVNEAYAHACGRPLEQIIGRTVKDIWPEPTAQMLKNQDAAALNSQAQHRSEDSQAVAGGGLRHFEYISTPVLDDQGRLVGVSGVARDITEIREGQERIRHMAEHDILTGLPNRAFLNERMLLALANVVGEQAGIAVLFLDLDHFKNVNDTLGHEIGDQLLLQVAQRLRDNLDERDTISRQGGDEFTVLIQHYGTPSSLAAIAQRLIDVMLPPFRVGDHELPITVSIGISTYPHDGTDLGTLLRNADTAMYQAKAAGGSAYQFFTPEMNARVLERVQLENSLRRALQQQEFMLHYQPQVDAASGKLLGLEALVRWRHPEQGEIPPGRFIPVAEETSLINAIGEWVLREACRQNRAWIDRGLPPVVVAVNLSAVQFMQRDLAGQVASALSEAGLAPHWLELEITESVVMRDTQRILEVLGKLRALGVKLSVDDFGTGYSSLGYLKRLPFDKIKIDQSFIRDLPDSEDDAAITRAIIGIADSLQKEVIAEGVETLAQRDFLIRHGCRQMQGFYFSRPLPVAEIEAYMARTDN